MGLRRMFTHAQPSLGINVWNGGTYLLPSNRRISRWPPLRDVLFPFSYDIREKIREKVHSTCRIHS